MKVLLCAATEMEIAATVQHLKKLPNSAIDILITGIGLTACTYAITKKVASSRPDFILQAGIAGSLDLNLALTTVVVVANETIGDMGVQEADGFQSLSDMKLSQNDIPPWINGRLANNAALLNNVSLPAVGGVTVNEISTNADRITYYHKQLVATVESMEGAALHYIALLENIPFLQIRSISNFAGERDKTKWMMADAIGNLNLELQRILSKLFPV